MSFDMSIEDRQIAHFDNLIRQARFLGFADDVEYWEAQKAAYRAEVSGSEGPES